MHSMNRKNVGWRLTQILSAIFALMAFGAVGCEYHYPGEGITESRFIDMGDGTTLPESTDGTVNPASPDVTTASVCGNGTCEAGETTASCAADCPAPPPAVTVCGNGTCEAGETTTSCASDCPVVPPPPPGGSGPPCTAETDAAFCTRLTKNCGSVIANDNCGASRTVASCGTCSSGQTCGAETPNVCGSPYRAFFNGFIATYETEDSTPPPPPAPRAPTLTGDEDHSELMAQCPATIRNIRAHVRIRDIVSGYGRYPSASGMFKIKFCDDDDATHNCTEECVQNAASLHEGDEFTINCRTDLIRSCDAAKSFQLYGAFSPANVVISSLKVEVNRNMENSSNEWTTIYHNPSVNRGFNASLQRFSRLKDTGVIIVTKTADSPTADLDHGSVSIRFPGTVFNQLSSPYPGYEPRWDEWGNNSLARLADWGSSIFDDFERDQVSSYSGYLSGDDRISRAFNIHLGIDADEVDAWKPEWFYVAIVKPGSRLFIVDGSCKSALHRVRNRWVGNQTLDGRFGPGYDVDYPSQGDFVMLELGSCTALRDLSDDIEEANRAAADSARDNRWIYCTDATACPGGATYRLE